MEESLENKEVVTKEIENQKIDKKVIEDRRKTRNMKNRTLIVLGIIAIFVIGIFITFRADYLETLEIGEEYIETFMQNVKYKFYIGVINFVCVFCFVCITNKLIRKGLKQFFDEEKKEMPKLPNKSLAFIIALVTSLIVSNLFFRKTLLFINSAQFGILDPIYNMDIGFYMFQAPLIGQLLYYAIAILIILTIYTVMYYLISFNTYFEGINGQTLRNNIFIKQLLFNVMLIAIFVSAIIFFNMQNIVIGEFLNLDDKIGTSIVGSGAVDSIKIWGYRILGVIIVISVYIAIKAFKKNNTKRVIKSLSVVPVYLIGLFVVLFGYKIIFIRGSELDKQKSYITTNIDFTKTAYDINIEEVFLTSTGTITEKEADDNQNVINNIPVVTEDIAINNLLQKQTSTGYYTYNKAKASLYNDTLSYIAARELNSNYEADEYTHGYGAVITSANETDEAGNVKYISREFENSKIEEPRIYYGTGSSKIKVVGSGREEFDYPRTTTENATYSYEGEGGISLNLLDRICIGVKNGNLGVILSNKENQILLNRNIVERAKRIMPYLMYDEEPYLVVSDEGKLYWVLDAYTTSNEYPYSQKTKIVYKNDTKEINYIRNSVKVIVNAFDGETSFYITDKTDPIAMVYNNMYKSLFKEESEIPERNF